MFRVVVADEATAHSPHQILETPPATGFRAKKPALGAVIAYSSPLLQHAWSMGNSVGGSASTSTIGFKSFKICLFGPVVRHPGHRLSLSSTHGRQALGTGNAFAHPALTVERLSLGDAWYRNPSRGNDINMKGEFDNFLDKV